MLFATSKIMFDMDPFCVFALLSFLVVILLCL